MDSISWCYDCAAVLPADSGRVAGVQTGLQRCPNVSDRLEPVAELPQIAEEIDRCAAALLQRVLHHVAPTWSEAGADAELPLRSLYSGSLSPFWSKFS